jgi:hypothetical protein
MPPKTPLIHPLENAAFRMKYADCFGDLFAIPNIRRVSIEDYSKKFIVRGLSREAHIKEFGFAVLTEEAVETIAQYGPCLEVGAGSGYWSYELRKVGVDIIVTDPEPPGEGSKNPYPFAKTWLEIERLTALDAIAKYPNRTLLTVWPSYDSAWTGEMLQTFQGNRIVYVGEGHGGCTGDDVMHEHLEAHFDVIETLDIPRFLGLHDSLTVYKRKKDHPQTTRVVARLHADKLLMDHSGRKFRTEE